MSYRLPSLNQYPTRRTTTIRSSTNKKSIENTQHNRVFTFLDDELLKKLEKYADDYKIKKSQVVRTALISYLKLQGYDKVVEQTRRL